MPETQPPTPSERKLDDSLMRAKWLASLSPREHAILSIGLLWGMGRHMDAADTLARSMLDEQ